MSMGELKMNQTTAENEKSEQTDLSREEIKFLQHFILFAQADWNFQRNSILSVFRKIY
jgi:hypothetical protein